MNNYIEYVTSIDYSWFQYINSHRWYVLDQTMPILTLFGDGITLLCFMAVLYLSACSRKRSIALNSFAAYCWVGVLVQIVKYAVHRLRPPAVVPDIHILGPALYTNSFPSGHTAAAFAVATVLASYYPQYRYLLFAIAVLVGYSRIYLGVHFPLDVLFGALSGVALGRWVIWYDAKKLIGFRGLLDEK